MPPIKRTTKQARAKSSRKINKPPVLFRQTQAIIADIEQRTGLPILTYWNSSNGSICDSDVLGFYEILQHLGQPTEVNLLIKSHGGHGESSLRIVNLLRTKLKTIHAVIPLECASAATMLALGADDIQMGPLAHLTPVDSSLTHDLSPIDRDNNRVRVSLDELQRVIKLWSSQSNSSDQNPYKEIYPFIHPLVLGAVDRLSSLSTKICDTILSYHIADPKYRKRISEKLNGDFPSHSYPITFMEAKKIGLKVEELDPDLNDRLLELNELYSQMGKKAYTDFDEHNYHDHEILNILEGRNVQVFFQNDKDWHYRQEERRWITLNDESSWQRVAMKGNRVVQTRMEIR